MKKRITLLLTALMCLAGAGCALAGMFDDYYDYQNEDGSYSYYFDQGVTVTMDEEWYRNTIVIPETTPGSDSGITTRRIRCHALAPRSSAASKRLTSIFDITV